MPILLPNLHTETKTGYEILQPFLNKQGREPDKVIGDGNCLFRALSRNITGVEDHHLLLRKAISDFEENNPVLFTGLSSAIIQVPLQEHLKRIKKPYVWGTTLEIFAAASLLQMDVYVATDSYRPGVATWLLVNPKPPFVLKSRQQIICQLSTLYTSTENSWIELTYVLGCHFDSIRCLHANPERPQLVKNEEQAGLISAEQCTCQMHVSIKVICATCDISDKKRYLIEKN